MTQDEQGGAMPSARATGPSDLSPASGSSQSSVPIAGDLERAFRYALLTLNLSLHHTAQAERLFADGLNNAAGHMTVGMAGRVIAATRAAKQAMLLERHTISQWLFQEADYARQAQLNAHDTHPDKLYRMGQKDGLSLAAATVRDGLAQGMAARSDETPSAAQPEGQQPDPEGDAPQSSEQNP